MAGFLLFVDGKETVAPRHVLSAYGCDGIVRTDDPEPATAVLGDLGGPSGRAGLLILPRMCGDQRDPALVYRAERQTWQQVRLEGERVLWIGQDLDSPLVPTDIVRESTVPGPQIRLRDGNLWTVPNAFAERSYYGIDGNGFPARKKEPTNQRLYDQVAPWFRALESHYASRLNPEDVESFYDSDAAMLLACDLLAENYRVSRAVVIGLGLLTVNDVAKVIAWASKPEYFVALQEALETNGQEGSVDG